MISVALTGGIGSGKSTVAGLFAAKGAFVVDADAVARDVMMPGSSVFKAVRDRFGSQIVDARGLLDRKELARIVFADPAARRDLESLTHPVIAAEMARRVVGAPASCRVLVLEIPLLAEVTRAPAGGEPAGTGGEPAREESAQSADGARSRDGAEEADGEVDPLRPKVVVVVDAPEEVVLRRLEAGRQMSREEALARIAAQAARGQRRAIADFVIDNSSSIAHLRSEVDRVWDRVAPAPPDNI